MSKNLALLLLATLGVAACSGHLGVAPPQKLDLSGHWALNGKLSDDPGKVVHEQERRGRERRDRDRDRMAGDMENPPLPGPESRPEPPTSSARTAYRRLWEKAQEARLALLDSGSRLEITQSASELKLVSDGSAARYVYGEKVIISIPHGAADRYAGWDGRRFIVRTDSPDGLKLFRQYELTGDGSQLLVVSEMTGEGQPTTVRQVYDRTRE